MTIWVIEVEDGGQADWVPYSEHDVVLVYLTRDDARHWANVLNDTDTYGRKFRVRPYERRGG